MSNQDIPHADTISWTASEFVEHGKGIGWFAMLGAIAAVVAVIVFLVGGNDWFSAITSVVIILILGVFATRRPDDKEFTVSGEGVYIGEELHPYESFESFSIVHDGNFESIYLTPHRRFAAPINLYFPVEQGDAIVDIIADYVPYDEKDLSFVDRTMHRLRF